MQRQRHASWTKSESDQPLFLDRDYIRARARWIRDELDPQLARDGPDNLSPDIVITLFTFLEELRQSTPSLDTIRYSRVHLALLDISGCATRWPGKLITKSDHLIKHLEASVGPLADIRPLLYEEGGRLHGISTPEDIERDKLLVKWLRAPNVHVSPALSRRHGDLGFTPGDWWINSMFAYRAGIIDNGNPMGGITCDANGAYALLMTQHDEVESTGFNSFVYRARTVDTSRYRLTSADVSSRQPVRILRHHSLRSFWTPRTGVRYEGLFDVKGWGIIYNEKTRHYTYHITFQRSSDQVPMKQVLQRPTAEEVDDYREHKRIRQEVKLARNTLHRAKPLGKPVEASPSAHIRRESQVRAHSQRHPLPQRIRLQRSPASRDSQVHQSGSPTKARDTNPLYVETKIANSPPLSPVSMSPVRPGSSAVMSRGASIDEEDHVSNAPSAENGSILSTLAESVTTGLEKALAQLSAQGGPRE